MQKDRFFTLYVGVQYASAVFEDLYQKNVQIVLKNPVELSVCDLTFPVVLPSESYMAIKEEFFVKLEGEINSYFVLLDSKMSGYFRLKSGKEGTRMMFVSNHLSHSQIMWRVMERLRGRLPVEYSEVKFQKAGEPNTQEIFSMINQADREGQVHIKTPICQSRFFP